MDGGGTLICVVGPSGAGKDTLINAAREHFAGDARFVFPQRYISRGSTPDEPHIPISEDEFERMLDEGAFFLHWRAHGVAYALGREVGATLREGRAVVANISRQMIGAARDRWPQTVVIHVTVDPIVLRERLEARGRDSVEDVVARLARRAEVDVPTASWVFEIDNSGDIFLSCKHFYAALTLLKNSHLCLNY